MISVGLLGGTGYTGKKLIGFCAAHPYITDYTVYGSSTADEYLYDVFPELAGQVENKKVRSIASISMDHDVYFVTLPHGAALRYVPELIAAGKKVIDLGGDYRLDSTELYRQWYNIEHTSGSLLKKKFYGLADFVSDGYESAQLIANPGCYPTAALLSLLPLASAFGQDILTASCVAYSGTSGAGKALRGDLMFSEMQNNVKAYNVNSHRHEPEILQMLNGNGFDTSYTFTTHLLPVNVGIYSTTAVHLLKPVTQEAVNELYEERYAGKPFVRIRKTPPQLGWVINTNFCDLNIAVKNNTIIITAAIDNLIKGAAGQAVQNLNLLYGWDETTGILQKENEYVSNYK